MSVDPLADITVSPYAYVWNDPVNYADPTGLMGERKGGDDPGDGRKPDPNKIYGPKGGVLIEEVIIKGTKKSNGAQWLLKGYFDLNKGFDDGIMDYTKDVYHFATKNAYSKDWWGGKAIETFNTVVYIDQFSKIRPDGSSNGIDLFNSVSEASAYDVGHFAGYNRAQFATTAALTEGGGFLLNSIRSIRLSPKVGMRTLSKQEMANIWGSGSNIVKIGTIDDDVMMFSSQIGTETVEGVTNFAVQDVNYI